MSENDDFKYTKIAIGLLCVLLAVGLAIYYGTR